MTSRDENNVAIIGAGLFGLVTAKVLLQETKNAFASVAIFEKQSEIGGVWSKNRIYPGLASNSPALTYEIPGFEYPENMRNVGSHVEAADINTYLQAFAEIHDLKRHVEFNSEVQDVSWDADSRKWFIKGRNESGAFERYFKFLIVCNGLYHTKNLPTLEKKDSPYPDINIFHSADVGCQNTRQALSASKHTLVVGAGKSAIDLATMIARRTWHTTRESAPQVTLVYKRPHWLSPRAILGGMIYFERILFSRFLNSWLPFAKHPDALHSWIGETSMGKRLTSVIFRIVENDFNMSLGQTDLPQTIPQHPLREALSGALHVVPKRYLELVRSERINIIEGSIESLSDSGVEIELKNGNTMTLDADNILFATGYRIAFPFFTTSTLQQLGLAPDNGDCDPNNLPYLKLHRLLVPTATAHQLPNSSAPYRNIAFNGFAYSLLNPTIAFISAHWIAEYFLGVLSFPDAWTMQAGKNGHPTLTITRVVAPILVIAFSHPHHTRSISEYDVMRERLIVVTDVEQFYEWQSRTFGKYGKKGVHIGSHATLYADLLLSDMGVDTGHVKGWKVNPVRMLREWFRPMYPQIYRELGEHRKRRDEGMKALAKVKQKVNTWDMLRLFPHVAFFLSLWWIAVVELLRNVLRAHR